MYATTNKSFIISDTPHIYHYCEQNRFKVITMSKYGQEIGDQKMCVNKCLAQM